jgi:hypothetical protein
VRLRPVLYITLQLIFLFTGALSAEQSRYVVNTGHIGQVNRIEYHQSSNTFVTAGDDGTLRVWDGSARRAVYRIQASLIPIKALSLHPLLPQAVIVETDNVSVFRLSVWDWEKNREVFSLELAELPLELGYSPSGKYIIYSITDWESITVLDSRTGKASKLLDRGFGIVSAFTIGTSEKKLLAYKPSGSIQYREMVSGNLSNQFPTVAGVTDCFFTSDNRFMLGKWEDSIIAIDLTSGVDVALESIDNLKSIYVDRKTNEILCYIADKHGDADFKLYDFVNESFRNRYSQYSPPNDEVIDFLLAGGAVYTASESGTVYRQTPYRSTPVVFSENKLAHITDIEPNGSILLITPDHIITLYSNFLHSDESSSPFLSDEPLVFFQDNPLKSNTRINTISENLYLLWDEESSPGRLIQFDPVAGPLGPIYDDFEYQLISVDVADSSILALDSTGQLSLFDLLQNESSFSYNAFGLRKAIFVGRPNILISGRSSSIVKASMYHINTITSETFPLSTNSAQRSFDLVYDPEVETAYSLSVETASGSLRTVLRAHTGATFEKNEIVDFRSGADEQATFAADSGALFASIGGQYLIRYPGSSRFLPVDQADNVPKILKMTDRWLFSLNKDSSITLWEKTTGKKALDFYLFKDFTWAAVTPSSGYLHQGNVNAYITEY